MTKPTKSEVEAGAKAAHNWLKWPTEPKYETADPFTKKRDHSLARAVLRAAAKARGK